LQYIHSSKYFSLLILDKVSPEAVASVASMETTYYKQFVETNREKEVLLSVYCICISKVLIISNLTFDIFPGKKSQDLRNCYLRSLLLFM
jgi:hypothetical protein